MTEDVLLVLSTFPDAETARRISTELVNEKLVACANLLPPVQSIYSWQGKLEEGAETLVFFKTTAARFPDLQAKLRELHPYEVPEIIALKLSDGLPDYLRWVDESCSPVARP
ncbi:MAG TPA: divalent-cation tolerance protein CutA [Chthoniobacterales bacterium]|nr:divalent-cation tolerance protein CutA [Chthoniobacterales bacterium]